MPNLCCVFFFSGQRWRSTAVRCNAEGANNVSLAFVLGKDLPIILPLLCSSGSICRWGRSRPAPGRAPLPLRSTTYSRRRSTSTVKLWHLSSSMYIGEEEKTTVGSNVVFCDFCRLAANQRWFQRKNCSLWWSTWPFPLFCFVLQIASWPYSFSSGIML